MDKKNKVVDFGQAERNARKRDFEKDSEARSRAEELKKSLLDQLKELTGEEHFIGTSKDPFAGEPFNQTMHRNLDLLNKIGVTGSYASYQDFFDNNGNYKLRDEVSRVYDLIPKDRGVYEKELLKIDERLNILNMMFSGGLLKIIPVTNDANNTWISNHSHGNGHDSQLASNFFNSYTSALKNGIETNNYVRVRVTYKFRK